MGGRIGVGKWLEEPLLKAVTRVWWHSNYVQTISKLHLLRLRVVYLETDEFVFFTERGRPWLFWLAVLVGCFGWLFWSVVLFFVLLFYFVQCRFLLLFVLFNAGSLG